MDTKNKADAKSNSQGSSPVEAKDKHARANKTYPAAVKKPFQSVIKWSLVFAAITTYTHFFGFSFVKGKLQAAGFYSSDISLDVNETLHEAAAATQMGLYSIAKHFFSDEVLQTAIVLAVSLPCAYLIIVGLPILESVKGIEKVNGVVQGLKSKLRGGFIGFIKKSLISAILSFTGFILPYLVAMAVVTLISLLWLGMSLGQNLGETYTQNLIEKKVCKPFSEAKTDIFRGCMAMQLADGSVLSGRILHQEKSKLFFLTNNGTYQINDKLEVQYSSCIHRVKEAEGPPSEIVTGCMARCEPSCQHGNKQVNSPTP